MENGTIGAGENTHGSSPEQQFDIDE